MKPFSFSDFSPIYREISGGDYCSPPEPRNKKEKQLSRFNLAILQPSLVLTLLNERITNFPRDSPNIQSQNPSKSNPKAEEVDFHDES